MRKGKEKGKEPRLLGDNLRENCGEKDTEKNKWEKIGTILMGKDENNEAEGVEASSDSCHVFSHKHNLAIPSFPILTQPISISFAGVLQSLHLLNKHHLLKVITPGRRRGTLVFLGARRSSFSTESDN